MDILKLKAIGQFQSVFMWFVTIPMMPYIGSNNLEFQIRSTSVPGKTRNKTLIRYLGKQFSQPGAVDYDGEITTTVLQSETHGVYDKIHKWSKLIDEVTYAQDVDLIKTDMYIKLLSLNKNITTKRFKLSGVYPLSFPGVEGLDQAASEGQVNFDCVFSYDDIDYDENNNLTF